jgi:hypothetical protein
MSALGHKRTFGKIRLMSALPAKADVVHHFEPPFLGSAIKMHERGMMSLSVSGISPVAIVRARMTIRMSRAIWEVANRRSRFDWISRVLWTNAECALKTADDAPNGAADDSTNWSGRIVSNVCAVFDPIGNPLRTGSQRRRQHHYRSGGK